MCSQRIQRLHQHLDRSVFHALRAGDGPFARSIGEESGQETHSRTRCPYIKIPTFGLQRIYHEVCVVAIREVIHRIGTGAERIQNQRTIADAFGGGELNRCAPSPLRSCYQIIHVCPSLEYSEGKSRKKQLHLQELLNVTYLPIRKARKSAVYLGR